MLCRVSDGRCCCVLYGSGRLVLYSSKMVKQRDLPIASIAELHLCVHSLSTPLLQWQTAKCALRCCVTSAR